MLCLISWHLVIMSIIPFPRFQLEKSRKAVFKECAKLDLVISLKSQRLLEEKRIVGSFQGEIKKNRRCKDFFPKFYFFWGNLCIQNFITRIVLTYNKYLSKTCKVYSETLAETPLNQTLYVLQTCFRISR